MVKKTIKKYDWKITLKKGVEYALYFGVPALISYVVDVWNPAFVGLSIGAVLKMGANWLKNRKA